MIESTLKVVWKTRPVTSGENSVSDMECKRFEGKPGSQSSKADPEKA